VNTRWKPHDCIAVLGSARRYTDGQLAAAFHVGRDIGRRGKVLLTGATTGIPYAAALGAHQEGGLVIGISPATNPEEHRVRYKKPTRQADVIVFTGQGPDGRSPLIMRSAKASIFIGGELGTLGEFCSGWMCGANVLGILRGAGGIADRIEEILAGVDTSWGSQIIYDSDPSTLVQRVCDAIAKHESQSCSDEEEPDEDVRQFVSTLIKTKKCDA
jgi:uncharacterized protein (TIGR00725 family)